jgi:biopolymer transport protein TolQ
VSCQAAEFFPRASDKFESADCVCYGSFARQNFVLSKGETISGLALLLFASPLTLLEQTSGVARVILGILLLLSIFSWALILQKYSQLGGIDSKTSKFLQMFRAGRGLSDPNTLRAGVGGTPLISVYAAGYRELESQIGGAAPRGASGAAGKVRNANAVGVEMQVVAGEEVRRLEKGMSSLATIASVSPFIGLFGTVWGVMDAFAGLGDAGAASLRAVAPGIAEALVTTAAGLFAAIPALIAYNHYLHGIRGVASRMNDFAAEFVSKVETLYNS